VKCPRCQHENPSETKFCGNCAAPLLSPSQTETYQTPVLELKTGTTFAGRYQVIEELGHGGMGRVYKVHDTELNEKVALKLLRPEMAADADTVERFRNELKSARQVTHKNVCRMFDIGRAEGAPYITMEYVHGEDLKRLIRKVGQMPAGRTVAIARQVAEGLAEAHAHGIVHRDLKPQNIMVDEGGNVHIMDFGIARSLEKKGLTGAGVTVGTPEYMSPEQVEGKPVDARSDIYSLGIILYEMMTGRVPFEGDTPFTVGVKHKSELPRDPLELNPQMPRDLARLILRCLEKDKEKRFQNAAALLDELGRIEQALPTTERVVPKHRPHTSKQVTVTVDVKRVAVPVVAGILIVAAALVLWLVVLKKHVVRPAPGKPTLAVLYFKNNTGDANLDIWRTALPELIIADLAQSRYIDVTSDSQIYGVLRELNLTNATAYAPEDLKGVAEKTGATHILQGTLTKAGTSFRINTTLEDTSSGKIVSAEMVQGEGEASFHTMVDELGRKIKTGLQLTSREIASDIDRDVGKITSASPEAYKLYTQGRAYHMARDYKNSIALMEKAVAIDPGFAMAYRSLSAAYSNLGFRAKADENRQKALELADRISDRERWLIEGTFYGRSEKTCDKAIEAYTKVLELYPDDPIANNSLGVIYNNIEEPEKAAERYEICVKQRGAPYLYFGNLCGAYTQLGQYDKARAVVEGYLKTHPETAAAYSDLAGCYLSEGQYDQALAEADKAFTLAPSNFGIYATLGQAAMLKGDAARAEAEFKRLTEAAVKAGTPWRRINLAVFYASRGRNKDALEQISLATAEIRQVGEPSWMTVFNFFSASVFAGAGRYAEALKAAEQSYRIAEAGEDMTFVRFALWSKGIAYLGLESPAEAQKTADELKALVEKGMNKKSIHIWRDLQARIDLAMGNYARAVENARAAVDSLPPQSSYSRADGNYFDTLAKAYEATGELEKARHAYHGLQKLTRGRSFGGHLYALSFYRVGLIAEKQGDKAAARRNYERFLEIWKDADPGLPEVEDAKKRLLAL
jgi:serine/threonine protein kinase/Flp pilus assembly protein TadD